MRRLLSVVLLCALSVSAAHANAQDEWWREGGPRVRPQDDRTAALLEAGLLRSATLRDLVARVEQSDVFVFIGMNPFARASVSGAMSWMTMAGGYRYLRVGLNPTSPNDQTIATLGHELRHAIEVIDDATVTDQASLVALYRRIGAASRAVPVLGWETEAARETGFQVRRELVATPASTVARRHDARPSGKGS